MKYYPAYWTINPFLGGIGLVVPNYFNASGFFDENGELKIVVDSSKENVSFTFDAFMKRQDSYNFGIETGKLQKWMVSRRRLDQINFLQNRGQIEKAQKKIKGLSRAVILEIESVIRVDKAKRGLDKSNDYDLGDELWE